MKEFNFFRHGNADYKEYQKIKESENPQSPFDHENQDELDLTEKGKTLAKQEAETFFNSLDSKNIKLFFVSSNEARAIETASIFNEIAKNKGFNILKPENTRSKYSDTFANGDVRVIDTLSLNPKNVLVGVSMFNSGIQDGKYLDKLDQKTKNEWLFIRNLIDQNDKGSWAKNYQAYGEIAKKIFPEEVITVSELYNQKFKDILRLIKWATNKIQSQGDNIKIIAFGHEDYLLEFLNQEFNEEGIKNCEMINFEINDENNIIANFREKTKILSDQSDFEENQKKAA